MDTVSNHRFRLPALGVVLRCAARPTRPRGGEHCRFSRFLLPSRPSLATPHRHAGNSFHGRERRRDTAEQTRYHFHTVDHVSLTRLRVPVEIGPSKPGIGRLR